MGFMRKLVGKSGKSISVKAKDGEIFISRSTKVAVMRMSSQKAEAGKGFSQGSSKKTGLPGPINHRAPARVISETINFYLLVREVRAAWKMTRSQPSKIPIGLGTGAQAIKHSALKSLRLNNSISGSCFPTYLPG